MRYLIVGVWHGEFPEVDHQQTEDYRSAEEAAITITLHAKRQHVPDEVLVLEGNKVIYVFIKNSHYIQQDYIDFLDKYCWQLLIGQISQQENV
jgi:hypothetical protein